MVKVLGMLGVLAVLGAGEEAVAQREGSANFEPRACLRWLVLRVVAIVFVAVVVVVVVVVVVGWRCCVSAAS